MKKYRVFFETGASLSIDVELSDEEIEATGGDPLAASIEKAYDHLPGDVCAHCSGWGKKYSLDLGEWEIESERKTDDEGNVHIIETKPQLIKDGE